MFINSVRRNLGNINNIVNHGEHIVFGSPKMMNLSSIFCK